jgi:hypothetical protein
MNGTGIIVALNQERGMYPHYEESFSIKKGFIHIQRRRSVIFHARIFPIQKKILTGLFPRAATSVTTAT